MITDSGSSTRGRQKKRPRGVTGSFYGAWDYIAPNGPTELITEFIVTFKKGNNLKKISSNATNAYQMSPVAVNKQLQ